MSFFYKRLLTVTMLQIFIILCVFGIIIVNCGIHFEVPKQPKLIVSSSIGIEINHFENFQKHNTTPKVVSNSSLLLI